MQLLAERGRVRVRLLSGEPLEDSQVLYLSPVGPLRDLLVHFERSELPLKLFEPGIYVL